MRSRSLAVPVQRVRLIQPKEFQECIWLNQWRLRVLGQEPRLQWLYHTANGELRDKRIADKLKAMGVVPGVVDYFLPSPCGPLHGWYLEMKRAGLTQVQAWKACSPDQQAFLTYVRAAGYVGVVASGWVDAAICLAHYLERPELAPEA